MNLNKTTFRKHVCFLHALNKYHFPLSGFHADINETLIKSVAMALETSGLRKLGYKYINLDDFWGANERNATGHMVADPKRFPSGAAGPI